MTTVLATDVLAELIQSKHRVLVQLRSLGERQLALAHDGLISELLDVLGLKQRILVQLQSIERELEPFRGEDPESRHWRSAEARRRCGATLAECESLLAAIVRQEKQSENELTRRRDEAARRLAGMHSAAEARCAYLTPAGDSAGQLDLKS
jgi:hypothetical protein